MCVRARGRGHLPLVIQLISMRKVNLGGSNVVQCVHGCVYSSYTPCNFLRVCCRIIDLLPCSVAVVSSNDLDGSDFAGRRAMREFIYSTFRTHFVMHKAESDGAPEQRDVLAASQLDRTYITGYLSQGCDWGGFSKVNSFAFAMAQPKLSVRTQSTL